jgi:hypothetical protein
MTAILNWICLINTHAPSGGGRKQEREYFYNTEVPYLLPVTQTYLILAGDLNCVLSHSDATGQRNYSRALYNLVTGLGLIDEGDTTSTRPDFTHYAPLGASRLDHIYISPTLQQKKQRVKMIVAAFTDHLAIVTRLVTSDPIPTRGRGFWHMNTSFLDKFRLLSIPTGQMDIKVEPHEIIPHQSDVVGEMRKVHVTTNTYLGRNGAKT